MKQTTIRVSMETKKELEELGRKGQTFNEIVHECIISKHNENLYGEYYFPYRTTGSLNLQYGKISAPKNENGEVEIHIEDIVEAVRSVFKENLIIKGYDE